MSTQYGQSDTHLSPNLPFNTPFNAHIVGADLVSALGYKGEPTVCKGGHKIRPYVFH